jgi:hypothetical protein
MKKLAVLIAAAAVLGAIVAGTLAQVGQVGRTGASSVLSIGSGPTPAEAAAKCDLPAGKLQQIDQILSAAGQTDTSKALAAWEEAIRSGDRERMEAARQDVDRAREAEVADRRKNLDAIRKVLSDEEYGRFEAALTGPDRATQMSGYFRRLKALNLDIGQEVTIDKVLEDAQARIERALTEEQRQKLAEATSRAEQARSRAASRMGERPRLTEEQRAALRQIQEDYRQRLANASPDERRQIWQEMSEKMRQVTESAAGRTPATGQAPAEVGEGNSD